MQLFVDNLTNVDFSYLHPDRGLLGETWLANIQLEGALNAEGMVCDFGIVKKVVRQFLDLELDHRLAVPLLSPNLTLVENGEQLDITWKFSDERELHCISPRSSIALIPAEIITANSVSLWCKNQLEAILSSQENESINVVISFTNEAINGSFYHYSHGLKKHDGNCQRIAHGHRSRIDIWENEKKSPTLENLWATRFKDIYIGSQEDITNETAINNIPCYTFSYTAQQGEFYLCLPKSCCYIVDTDTTVEWIAQHIASTAQAENTQSKIRVRAYEGINKGAEV